MVSVSVDQAAKKATVTIEFDASNDLGLAKDLLKGGNLPADVTKSLQFNLLALARNVLVTQDRNEDLGLAGEVEVIRKEVDAERFTE